MALRFDAGCFTSHDDCTFRSTLYTVELASKPTGTGALHDTRDSYTATGFINDTRDSYKPTGVINDNRDRCKYGKTNRPESDDECAIRNARQKSGIY